MADVTLISCYSDSDLYGGLLETVPASCDTIAVGAQDSIAHTYNLGAKTAEVGIFGFVHQDVRPPSAEYLKVLFRTRNVHRTLMGPVDTWAFGRVALEFHNDTQLGVIGFIGSDKLTCDGRWWNAGGQRFGRILQGEGLVDYGPEEGSLVEVAAVDGFGFFTPAHVFTSVGGFDERYPGFHLYDADYCTKVRQAGYKVAVLVHQMQHLSGGSLDDNFFECQRIFREKWTGVLPA